MKLYIVNNLKANADCRCLIEASAECNKQQSEHRKETQPSNSKTSTGKKQSNYRIMKAKNIEVRGVSKVAKGLQQQ